MAVAINSSIIKKYFSLQENDSNNYLLNQTYTCMENSEQTISASPLSTGSSHSNKILYKGIITAVLILLMLIPMMFIQDLVKEREQRQNEVVNEVSSKWATAQTITTPYLAVPYKDTISKKTKHLIILSENLDVTGNVIPEERTRSIYKVLLYRSALNLKANFHFKLPADIDAKDIYFSDAKLCLGLSDFKGIEEKIKLSYNTVPVAMTPGLPVSNIDSIGLSAPVQINASDNISFDVSLKLKGSERLNFMPLSANSNFQLSSSWQNPSFDGNILPSQRIIDNNGFKATWSFNEANLPFATILKDEKIDKESFAFGVNMVQPADQYAKTMRSVKYAILFIGLTFALFFIIELMQQKPVHPVQYVLVGLALVIFYSLLLSISEFLLFNQAYLIAASAIVILITLYAKGHFRSWKIAGIFGILLTALYGFIYILISLEDTALLVGSIGLFAVLSLIMYASRKINWYNPILNHPATALEK
jgi:inner membrane protein